MIVSFKTRTQSLESKVQEVESQLTVYFFLMTITRYACIDVNGFCLYEITP